EVVLVQPLHDDDDGAVALVIEPAVKGVVVPLVGGFALRVGERLLGFSGSSIRMMSAPRPVSTPPVEVASRYPCRVVTNSCTAWRCGARRVGKICRYHGLITMLRQSRASLLARSWA